MAKFYRKGRTGQRVWRDWCRLARAGKIKVVRRSTTTTASLHKVLRREAAA